MAARHLQNQHHGSENLLRLRCPRRGIGSSQPSGKYRVRCEQWVPSSPGKEATHQFQNSSLLTTVSVNGEDKTWRELSGKNKKKSLVLWPTCGCPLGNTAASLPSAPCVGEEDGRGMGQTAPTMLSENACSSWVNQKSLEGVFICDGTLGAVGSVWTTTGWSCRRLIQVSCLREACTGASGGLFKNHTCAQGQPAGCLPHRGSDSQSALARDVTRWHLSPQSISSSWLAGA